MLYPDLVMEIPADPACDLRSGPCASSFGDDASVLLSIEPRDIPLVKPLQIEVDLQGVAADRVEVDFSGVDMDMGFNRVKLEALGGGRYGAKGILPVCVRDSMEWEAKVLINTPEGLASAAYRFFTVRPGLSIPVD
jgi:hypothetical protein